MKKNREISDLILLFKFADIKSNENKFYSLELHVGKDYNDEEKYYRIFTNYGRIEDVATGLSKKECRYLPTLKQAEVVYDLIFQDKTAICKGYQKIDLAATNIGSNKLKEITTMMQDDQIIHEDDISSSVDSQISSEVYNLVNVIFQEATNELTSKISAQVTNRGIETPLGLLTKNQIKKGEEILEEIEKIIIKLYKRKKQNENQDHPLDIHTDEEEIRRLSSKFYSLIPHSLGKSYERVSKAILDNIESIEEKKDTLQLMMDMIDVIQQRSTSSSNLSENQIKYHSLGCKIQKLNELSNDYKSIYGLILPSLSFMNDSICIKNIFQIKREKEWNRFTDHIFNTRLLFHGSKIDNWLGILSRGIIMPRQVVKMGISRTDIGLMGFGLYFAENFEASAKYCTPASSVHGKSKLLAVCSVALGNVNHLTKSDSSLTKPPLNYHSCHGIKSTEYEQTDFIDSEFTIYDTSQYKLEYLIEFTYNKDKNHDLESDEENEENEIQTQIISENNDNNSSSWLIDYLSDREWKDVLRDEFGKDYFIALEEKLEEEYRNQIVYPPKSLIFNCLNECSLSKVKVVILGQDPYHNGYADGLAFSSSNSYIPPSLSNIFKELQIEYPNFVKPSFCSLQSWANQGVLLINTIFTVREKSALSHQFLGWENFTDAIFKILNQQNHRIVFLLWGKNAKCKSSFITNPIHKILVSSHPSPFSVHLGFENCFHFSKANFFLEEHQIKPINWHILPPKDNDYSFNSNIQLSSIIHENTIPIPIQNKSSSNVPKKHYDSFVPLDKEIAIVDIDGVEINSKNRKNILISDDDDDFLSTDTVKEKEDRRNYEKSSFRNNKSTHGNSKQVEIHSLVHHAQEKSSKSNVTPINSLSPFLKSPIVKIRILFKSSISTWKFNGKNCLFFQLEVMDEFGHTAKVCANDEQVLTFYPKFKEDQVSQYITNKDKEMLTFHYYFSNRFILSKM